MRTSFVSTKLRNAVVLACLSICSAVPALAQERASSEALIVTLYSDRYVAAGQVFSDPDALQVWVERKQPKAIYLDVCDPAANLRLLAAAHRFRDVYLELRPMVTGQPACEPPPTVQAVRVSGAVRPMATPTSTSSDAQAVDLYWRGLMP